MSINSLCLSKICPKSGEDCRCSASMQRDLREHFPFMGAYAGTKDGADWDENCLDYRVRVYYGDLGMEFDVAEGTLYIVV